MKRSPLAPSSLPVLHPVAGIRLATAASGIKYKNRDDVMVMVADDAATIAGAVTRSKTCSAAVDWCKSVLTTGSAKAILVNAGNANAFTGKRGLASVERMAKACAETFDVTPQDILLASTGVIGEPLDDPAITAFLPQLCADLSDASWAEAAAAIMTTDTFAKAASAQVDIDGEAITITGIAKGSGMIAPDMATMLAFIATDAAVNSDDLMAITRKASDESFNAITVDGDTSTSDTVLVMATGQKGTTLSGAALTAFQTALKGIMVDLAQQIVRDGEGAEKLITITVTGAEDDGSARRVGLAIANSPLVKTAVAGEDANWGRVVMAVGKSGEPADRDRLSIAMGGVVIARDGDRVDNYDETPVAAHMKTRDIHIDVDLGIGQGEAQVWTCDLTHGYITINADYRS